MPSSWKINKLAGEDWSRGFQVRNSDISLRKPVACSLVQATAFNCSNVNKFYDKNLETGQKRNIAHFSGGTRIYNLDETNTTNVQKTQKNLAPKNKNLEK